MPLCTSIKTGCVNVILKMLQQHYSDCKELVLFGITAKNGLRRACSPTFLSHKWRAGQWPRRKSPQFCRLWNCKLNPLGIRPAIPCCLSELYLCTLCPPPGGCRSRFRRGMRPGLRGRGKGRDVHPRGGILFLQDLSNCAPATSKPAPTPGAEDVWLPREGGARSPTSRFPHFLPSYLPPASHLTHTQHH